MCLQDIKLHLKVFMGHRNKQKSRTQECCYVKKVKNNNKKTEDFCKAYLKSGRCTVCSNYGECFPHSTVVS